MVNTPTNSEHKEIAILFILCNVYWFKSSFKRAERSWLTMFPIQLFFSCVLPS